MTNREAYRLLRERLANCTLAQAEDIGVILRIGAGDLGLPGGAIMPEPAELPRDRRYAWYALVDGIRYGGGAGEDGDAHTFRPVHAGAWEAVLATLVIEANWNRISETAKELRG